MGVVDKQLLLREVGADSPTGPYIEYGEVTELERLAKETPVRYRAELLSADANPDWEPLAGRASDLLARTKDLRVAAILARALLYTQGLSGFGDGIEITAGLISTFWSGIHPPCDGDDATIRVNSVAQVGGREEVMVPLRRIALARSSTGKAYCLRDIELATQPPGDGDAVEPRPSPSEIENAFREANSSEVEETARQVDRCLGLVVKLDNTLRELAPGAPPELESVTETLRGMKRALHSLRMNGAVVGADESVGGGDMTPNGEPGAGPAGGVIRSRQDVVRALDQICSWYQAHEPSSPVPLLVQRAKRLVFLSFLDAVKDLSPGGLSEIKTIAGLEE